MQNVFVFILITVFLFSCNFHKIDEYGKFSIYRKLDDSLTNILVISNDKTSYAYNKELSIDLKTLKKYNNFLTDSNKAYHLYET